MKKENSSWILVYTKAKEEKRAKENLERQGYETFLPLMAKTNNLESKEVSFEAIFPRYIFIKINLSSDNWISIKSTKGVSHLGLFGDKFATVPYQIIELLKSKVDANNIFFPKTLTHQFQEGDKLTINKGRFAGVEAIFLSNKSKERVRLLLKFLNTSIVAEISKSQLEEKEIFEKFKL